MLTASTRFLRIAYVLVAAALLVWLLAQFLPMAPLDLQNYLAATRMLVQRQNPYGQVEFFAPPWLALLLLPLVNLPLPVAAAVWLLLSVAAVAASVALAFRWLAPRSRAQRLLFTTIIPTVMPAALYSYITGQLTPLVGTAVLASAWGISAQSGAALPVLGLLFASLKPHVALLPVLLCLLELVRKRDRRTILTTALCAGILAGLATLWQPHWAASLIKAWAGQDYKGGAPNLISPGYLGLRELGISPWLLIPLAAYTLLRWWRDGLAPHVLSLALPVNLLLIPYSRSYDHVLLILPLLYLAGLKTRRGRRLLATAMVAVFVLPLTPCAVLAPALAVIALLLAPPPPRPSAPLPIP